MRVRLKGINTVRKPLADGTVRTYHYHRATGTKLEGEPGTPEFVASFQAAARSSALARSAGTVEWLIRQYKESRSWTNLAPSTREIGEYDLKACEEKWGATPLKIVENPRSRPGFLKWHDKMADTHPKAASVRVQGLPAGSDRSAERARHGGLRRHPPRAGRRSETGSRQRARLSRA